MKGRAREFNLTRDRNLSQTYSQMGESFRMAPSYRETNALGQSQSSVFLKNKTPLCVNCTNHKLVQSRKERQFRDKGKQLEEQQKVMQKAKLQNQQQKAARAKQAQEIDRYNMRVSQRQLNSVKSEKHFDGVWAQQTERREKELTELEAEVAQLRKEKELRYRSELHDQVQQEQSKRQQLKRERLKTLPEQPIVKGEHANPQAEQYGQELKHQMEKDRLRKQQQKTLETQLNIKELTTAQEKFMEFTQFKSPKQHGANPELFEEMKQVQLNKKLQKIENRCLQEHERKAALKKQKETLERSAKEELQKMRKYADTLSAQIAQKKRQDQYQRNQDSRELAGSRFSEEFNHRPVTRQCGECHHEVRELELSYI